MTHFLGCRWADVHVTHGLTFDLVTCRSCHAETKVPR
jgi:hypothetical protein